MLNKIVIFSLVFLAACESKKGSDAKDARDFTGTYSIELTPVNGLVDCPSGTGTFTASQEDSFKDYLDIQGRLNFESGITTTLLGKSVFDGVIKEGQLSNYGHKINIEFFGSIETGGWYEDHKCSGTWSADRWEIY